VNENITSTNIQLWSDVTESFPSFLFQFVQKALQQQLPMAANLNRWKRTTNPFCDLCGGSKPQTNKHLLSNCSNPSMLERYTNRHNDVLKTLATWINENKSAAQKLFVDIDGLSPISDIFQDTCRPDLVIVNVDVIVVLELTVCHESNLLKSRNYKLSKYSNIANFLLARWHGTPVKLFTIEVSTLGFISDMTSFTKLINLPKLQRQLKAKLINISVNHSFDIYSNRNDPNLKFKISEAQ